MIDQSKEAELFSFYSCGIEDAIDEQDTAKLALNLRGLLHSAGWSEIKIKTLVPMFGLTSTPIPHSNCGPCSRCFSE